MTDRPTAEFPPPTLPAPERPAVPTLPTLPTLPPQPRSAPGPSAAAARFVAQPAFTPELRATRRRPKRWPKLLLALVLLAAVGGAVYALVLRDNASDDASSDELPDLEFTHPAITSATWVERSSDLVLGGADGFTTELARMEVSADYAHAVSMFVGTQTRENVEQRVTVVFTPDHSYASGDGAGPWTRRTRDGDDRDTTMDDPDALAMYADLVTDDVRAEATNVEANSSDEGDISVKRFTFDVEAGALAGSGFDLPTSITDSSFVARVTVTIDATTGLVRSWLVDFDEMDLRSALSPEMTSLPLTRGIEIVSLDQPVDIQVPTDYVDDQTSPCDADRKTLEVAIEAWRAQFGAEAPVTEAQLVADGFLRSESDTYDIVEGLVIPVSGGACA